MKFPWVSRKRYEEMDQSYVAMVGQRDDEIRMLRHYIKMVVPPFAGSRDNLAEETLKKSLEEFEQKFKVEGQE